MIDQLPVVFKHLPAGTMDVLMAIGFHYGCKELLLPQSGVGDGRSVLGPLCTAVFCLDKEAREALLPSGLRNGNAVAYLLCLNDADTLDRTWFMAVVVEQRGVTHDHSRVLRVQYSPLEDIPMILAAVPRVMVVPAKLPPTAEAIIDRQSSPPRPIY